MTDHEGREGGSGSTPPPGYDGTGTSGLHRPDLYANMDFDGSESGPEPTVCKRIDGQGIFYPGAINTLFGVAGDGKTWIALGGVEQALAEDGRVLFIDVDDNGRGAIRWRLEAFGTPREVITDKGRFLYSTPTTIEDLDAIVDDMKRWRPTLVVVDSIGTVVTMASGSANDADDFNRVNMRVLMPLSQTGAAVVYIDHLSKNPDSAKHGARGSSAKLDRISGASIRVTGKEPFIPGQGGQSVLTSNKDRHGGLWGNCKPLEDGSADKVMVGTFTMTEDDGRLSWEISPGGEAPERKRAHAQRDRVAELRAMDPRPQSATEAAKRLGGNKQAAYRAWGEFSGSGSTPPLGKTEPEPAGEEAAA
ncbi:AAA family ATPase [Nocardia sp. NPDC127526]|uniref:AAA family ATPase n=1 Tax=Nocardia sp. NPDC127526 TaxID=3345393 RepID=UPI003640E525